MAYPHSCVLLIGATSGIGLAMAEKFVSSGSKVIVVGRRKERLDAFITKHGSEKASAMAFDIIDTLGLPKFVEEVTSSHPELDCVFVNAGRSRMYTLSKPAGLDLKEWHGDIHLNFTSAVNITHAFLPFLMAKKGPTCLTYTGSNISVVPAPTLSSYCASKAALHSFIMCLREELAHAKASTKVFEIFAPPVQTELHDVSMGVERGRQFGMPVDQFADQAYSKLIKGEEQPIIPAPWDGETFENVVKARAKLFNDISQAIWSH